MRFRQRIEYYFYTSLYNIYYYYIKLCRKKEFKKKSDYKFYKNFIKLKYNYNDNDYIIFISKKRKPCNILKVLDNNNKDITKKFFSYAGINKDFHNSKLTPNFLNWDYIKIIYYDGLIKTIQKNEIIII